MPTAVYPGSLDPVTNGHVAAVADTARAFDKVVVAIGVNPAKTYLFSVAEREVLARQALAHIPNVEVTSFTGLLVHYLVRNGLRVVVRGLRNGRDWEDAHLQDSIGWQQDLARDITPFYVPARAGQQFVSSTILKIVLKDQGNALDLAPVSTIQATQARMLGQYMYGITGPSGVGKTHVSKAFERIAARRGIPLTHIDLDRVAHDILGEAGESLYGSVRADVVRVFGDEVANPDGTINRKALGQMVFGNPKKLAKLNNLLHDPIFFKLNDLLRGQSGIFLIDAALLAESGRTRLVNNNVLLVDAPDAARAARLSQRDGLNADQIARRLGSQYSVEAKAGLINKAITQGRWGTLERLTNDERLDEVALEAAFERMLVRVDIYGELRITSFLKRIGVADAKAAYHQLRKLHGGEGRYYHSLAHIVDGLGLMPEVLPQVKAPDAVMLAWLFHDAVYDAQRDDNEARSVACMEYTCAAWGLDPALVQAAKPLVLATRHATGLTLQGDAAWVADVDLAILGAEPVRYARYEQDVRREYAHLSDKAWAEGRRAFLAGLAKGPVYRTAWFGERFEAAARRNIAG